MFWIKDVGGDIQALYFIIQLMDLIDGFIPVTTDATKDICGIMVGFHEYNLIRYFFSNYFYG